MLTRMFSITCWPEAYTDGEIFNFIEVVNEWHATKRNQTGPIIVIDKWVSLALQLASGMCLCVNRENNSVKVGVRIEGKVIPLTELSEGVDCV